MLPGCSTEKALNVIWITGHLVIDVNKCITVTRYPMTMRNLLEHFNFW